MKQESNWDEEIMELEKFFSRELPKEIRLNGYTFINDISLMVNSHLAVIKANNGRDRYIPFLERLRELKEVLHESGI